MSPFLDGMEAVGMGDGGLLLSMRESDRVAVIREVAERRLRQSEAARRLGLGVRQVKRLVRRGSGLGTARVVGRIVHS